MSWHRLQIDGIATIERVVAVFEVGPQHDDLPMRFRVKVTEHQDGGFYAYPEIALKGPDGVPDYVAGAGNSIEEALASACRMLLATIPGKEPITEDSIDWNPRF